MNKHEEKHKSDVKENEKSGEMRGFATPKQGMRGKKQNRGFEALFLIHFSRIPLIINTLYHFSRVVIYKC